MQEEENGARLENGDTGTFAGEGDEPIKKARSSSSNSHSKYVATFTTELKSSHMACCACAHPVEEGQNDDYSRGTQALIEMLERLTKSDPSLFRRVTRQNYQTPIPKIFILHQSFKMKLCRFLS